MSRGATLLIKESSGIISNQLTMIENERHNLRAASSILNKHRSILNRFNKDYSKLYQQMEKALLNNSHKHNAQHKKAIARAIRVQERLVTEVINVANNLLEFITNPKTQHQREEEIKQYHTKARDLYEDGIYEEALFYLEKNEPIPEAHRLAHFRLKADILHQLKRHAQSNSYIEREEFLQMNDPEVFWTIGLNYVSIGEMDDNDPNKVNTSSQSKRQPLSVGPSPTKRSKVKEGIRYYQLALKINPLMSSIYEDMCQAHNILGNRQEYCYYKNELIRITESPEEKVFYLYELAKYMSDHQMFRQGIVAHTTVLQSQPDPLKKLTIISEIVYCLEMTDNNPQDMIEYLTIAIKIIRSLRMEERNRYKQHYRKLRECYSRCGNNSEELILLEEMLDGDTDYELYKEIAVCYLKIKQYLEAERYLLKYKKISPKDTSVYRLLYEMYFKKEDYMAAKDILLCWKEIDNNYEVNDKLLKIEREIGTDESLKELQRQLSYGMISSSTGGSIGAD